MSTYCCPYCYTHLNVHGFIVLSFKREQGKNGIILMNDQLGDYSSHLNSNVKFEKGEKAHFHCPSCSKSLEFKQNQNMARIIKIDENGREQTVIFSAIFGEESTYLISEERQLTYGEHAMKFLDPQWYKK